MMGFMKWLKNEGTSRKGRDSAPAEWINSNFDANRTRDESYRESMAKFTQYRTHERHQRTSMTLPLHESNSIHFNDGNLNANHFGNNDNISIVTDFDGKYSNDTSNGDAFLVVKQIESKYGAKRNPAHSMPTSSYKKNPRPHKNSNDTRNIHDNEVQEFEHAHCFQDITDDTHRSFSSSPPPKFSYKENSNPYPNHDLASAASSSDGSSTLDRNRSNPPRERPKKPARSINSIKSRKLLTEAHFNGAYKNFQFASPFYSDSSTTSSFPSMNRKNERKISEYGSLEDDATSQSTQYQVIRNKHGEDVEYAVPYVSKHNEYEPGFTQQLSRMADAGNDNELFEEDPNICEQIVNDGYEHDIRASDLDLGSYQKDQRRFPITDLDNSCGSEHLMPESDATSICKPTSISPIPTVDPFSEYFERVQQFESIVFKPMDAFRPADEGRQGCRRNPLFYENGTFEGTDATLRCYSDELDSSEQSEEFAFITKMAFLRDADILRKIRHPNNLLFMAFVFSPSYGHIGMIMEPTRCTLNHLLFKENKTLELDEVVTIVKKISSAAVFLNAFNYCHSNISSHSIMIADSVTNVKLSSFELALDIKSNQPNDGETTVKHNGSKLSANVSNDRDLPDCSMSNEQKIEQYKKLSKESAARERVNRSYSSTELQDIDLDQLANCPAFRQYFCEYYYQAPELLPINKQLIFPAKQTDAYGVTLLLWELLNNCIPFVIYSEEKHTELLSTNYPLKFLPIIEEQRCQRFNGILERGLKREPQTRIGLQKIIQMLNAIEVDIQVESEKKQYRIDDGGRSLEKVYRIPCRISLSKEACEKSTPDRSSKLISIPPSPMSANSAEKELSPLIPTNTTTMNNPSPLDYHKLLSPRREVKVNLYERTSTLKRRKKATPISRNKQNMNSPVEDDASNKSLMNTCDLNEEEMSTEHTSNAFNNALIKSAISRELSFQDSENASEITPKITDSKENLNNPNNLSATKSDKNSPENIVANNQIRSYNWPSPQKVNRSKSHEPVIVAVAHRIRKYNDGNLSTSTEETNENQRKLNVSIKIIRTQLSPVTSCDYMDSTKSENSLADDIESADQDSFSVKSRIKFFRSLEGKSRKRSPLKNRLDFSRRSAITYMEAQKVQQKSHRFTYPQLTPTRQNLFKEIPVLLADIQKNLGINPHLQTDDSGQMEPIFFSSHDDGEFASMASGEMTQYKNSIMANSRDESHDDENEKRNSVRETVQMFESSMRSDKNRSNSVRRSKSNNYSRKSTVEIGEIDNPIVTDEMVDDVIRVEEPSDAENECGARAAIYSNNQQAGLHPETNAAPTVKTMIKRTYYQESIICGESIEPNASGSNATYATKSMTTHVTLNMSKCKRRASDVGSMSRRRSSVTNNSIISNDKSFFNESRHSIASPIRLGNQVQSVVMTKRQIQSIEDLYIDDDYAANNLAANMRLLTTSSDSLDDINFNVFSEHMFEHTLGSEPIKIQTSIQEIEPAKITETTEDD